ncbi:hypothetical protein CBF45_07455 [Bordetella sp. J329]|nr:hypothetical protein CBF45_07455 [Bordetella sp. J329]
MARARNIKPSFFSNDDLADIDPLGRLLFIGLWTMADREGRLEDRPRRIKAEVLPYDGCDVDGLLQDLSKHGFILRYEVGGERFIQVLNFAKHQNPHVKESASQIPAPVQHSASTMQEQCKEQPEPEQAGLIPDSGFLIPDSSNNPVGLFAASQADGPADDLAAKPAKPAKPNCPHKEIVALYHEILPASPEIRDWTPARADALRVRWNEAPERQNLDWWRRFFGYVAESEFLTGRAHSTNRKPFCAPLEWILKAENFAKIREGRYHAEAA